MKSLRQGWIQFQNFCLRFEQVEDGKVLILLDIFKGEETPYYYSGDGVLEAYVRVGNESVKATSTELKRLVLRGRNTSYDSQISTYKVEDFAFSKLRERYKNGQEIVLMRKILYHLGWRMSKDI